MNWYLKVLKNYAAFQGRAQRAEYWFFALFNIIACVLLMVLDLMLGTAPTAAEGGGIGILTMIYALAITIPAFALSVRRLHDTNRSGWMLLINLIPLIGPIVILVFFLQDSTPGANQYGPNPKGV